MYLTVPWIFVLEKKPKQIKQTKNQNTTQYFKQIVLILGTL